MGSNNLSDPANPQSPLNPENPGSRNKEILRQQFEQERLRGRDANKSLQNKMPEKKGQSSSDNENSTQGIDASNPTSPRHLITPSPTR